LPIEQHKIRCQTGAPKGRLFKDDQSLPPAGGKALAQAEFISAEQLYPPWDGAAKGSGIQK